MLNKLNFGSGIDYKEGFVNIDLGKQDMYGKSIKCDIKHDLTEFPYPIEDNTFNYVIAKQVLEHFCTKDLYKIFKEFHRIVEHDGEIEIIVPFVSSHHSFHDPTHLTRFTEETIRLFFCHYHIPEGFKIIKSDIILSKSLFKFMNPIINLTRKTKTIYERFFSWTFPAQEIHIILQVVKSSTKRWRIQ